MSTTDYRLITDTDALRAACEELSKHSALGFDSETTSLDPYRGRLRLVQLASPEGVYVFDLFRLAPDGNTAEAESLEPLRRLLSSASPVKIAHNCLAGDMLVSMADGTKVRIDKLVRAKSRGKVLCFDERTRTLSTGEIVDWVDGGLRPWEDWLRICMRGKGKLRVTKDHEILTERGRVRAENLLIGDKVLTSLPELSQRQRDMLYGSLLGDGSLTKQRTAQARTPYFKVSHSLKQEGYVALKAAALDGLVKRIGTEKVHYRGFSNSAGGSQLISLTTVSDPRLFELYDNCLMSGKRILTPRWLDNLSMPAMAVWYCDDGTLRGGSSASICVSAFGADGADTLVEFLRSKGFPAKLWVRPDGQLYVKVVGPHGRGMSEELRRFWESIAPYVPVSMQYKLPAAYKHLASDKYWTTPRAQSRAFSDTVVEILPLLNDSSERGRYDGYRRGNRRGIRQYCLTVATHRNFIAGGLAVSNCKFDAKWVRHALGVELGGDYDSRANGTTGERVERGGLFDTLLASQLISAGEQEDRHSLRIVAERYLGETVDKTEQLSDWGGELSESQLEYAARDAAVMLPLRDKLIEQLRANALGRCAQLEFECVMPVAAMELAGLFLDERRWREQLSVVEKKRAQLAAELQDELSEESPQQSFFGPSRIEINLDSHVQLTKALTRLGVPVPDSTRNWKLQPLAHQYPVVAKLLDYRTVQKALTSYGENILKEINPKTGRIHANFHQIGAPTGRFACTNPNVQQVPHSIEYRRCFRAPAGRKLVISDYSQIELRILADFTNDAGFVDAFQSGADLHRVTAAQIFNVAPDDVTKEQRDFAKRLNFGVVYGIGARRFAMMTGLTETDAEDLLRRYFSTYRALDAWLREAAQKAVRERTAPRTVAGRLFRFNFDPEDKQAASLAQRNGKNSPIQGCLRKGTRILTAERGYIPIEEAADSEVTVWDGRDFVSATVMPSGVKRLVKLELWGGHYIECSPDHKFWTVDANGTKRWLKAEELAERKQIYVDITGPAPNWELPLDLRVFEPKDLKLRHQPMAKPHNAKTLSLELFSDRFTLGLWVGRLASDGSVSSLDTKRPGNIVLMVAEHEESILPELEAMTGTFGYFGKRTRITETQPGAFHSLTVGSISLTRQLLHYGIKDRVPDFLWKSKSALRGYLRGMFDGDGTVNRDGPVLTFGKGPSHHLAWARQIQEALLLFGVRSRINRCQDRINIRVLKRDTPAFAEQIGFMNHAKQSKLTAVVPEAYVTNSKIYGRAVRVKSVEVTDEWVEMYDVVNSASGQFMANGLITHNSSADIVKRALRLLHDELKSTTARVVNVIHDEIVVEADEKDAEEIALTVERSMCAAGEEYVKKVPIKVESSVADEWVK